MFANSLYIVYLFNVILSKKVLPQAGLVLTPVILTK